MNIVILTHAFPPMKGGFSSYTYEIARNWILAGEEVKIVTTVPPDEAAGFEAQLKARIVYLENKSHTVPENLAVFIKFLKIAFKAKADVVLLPVWLPYSIFMVLFSYLTFNKIPYVIGCHGADILGMYPHSSHQVHPIVKFLGRLALRRAAALFAVSNYTAERVRELGVAKHKIKVFPNGVDYHKFKLLKVRKAELLNRYHIRNHDAAILLTVSQFNQRKGIDTAIQIVGELKAAGHHVIYLIIGSGEAEADMIGLIEKYDLKDRVFILKGIDDEALIQFYNISDVFLLLSRQASDVNVEGFGIVFLEANACGLPVVAGNSGGIPDAVADGKSGFLVDPLDTQQIREKIIYLLQHPPEAKQMGEYGRKRVETDYNWPKITQDMIACLNGMVKKN